MKVYALDPLDEGTEYFPTKKAAIDRAKAYADDNMYIIEHEIGNLTKDVACKLASGQGFSISSREVWKAK